jgi:hypothetical protein
MREHSLYESALALAGVSLIAVVGALSVATYDWAIVTGVAILSVDMPILVGFARWIPQSLDEGSTWYDWVAMHLFLASVPLVVIGISFLLVHVHIVCGVLFITSSIISFPLYKRRLDKGPRES